MNHKCFDLWLFGEKINTDHLSHFQEFFKKNKNHSIQFLSFAIKEFDFELRNLTGQYITAKPMYRIVQVIITTSFTLPVDQKTEKRIKAPGALDSVDAIQRS